MSSFQKVTLLLLTGLLSVVSLSKEPESSKWTIKNTVKQFSMDKANPTKAGYKYWFGGKVFLNGTNLKLIIIKPHDSTHLLQKQDEDDFFVLEGKAKFHLNGDSGIAESYASFYCPSISKHRLGGASDTEFKCLVIKDYQKLKI